MSENTKLNHLNGLFKTPIKQWQVIDNEYHSSILNIVRHYYMMFFLLLPVSIILRLVISGKSFKAVMLQGLAAPVAGLLLFIFVLYLLSIIIEEAGAFLGGRVTPLSGAKIAAFSAYPFLAMTVFATIPYLGPVMLVTGFVYQLVLIFLAGKHMLLIPQGRLYVWFISVFLSFGLLVFLFAVLGMVVAFLLNLF